MSEMKLSEAIRLGGMATKQGRGSASMSSAVAPCALGGALLAIGKQSKDDVTCYTRVREAFPIASMRVPHPLNGFIMPLSEAIWWLNDDAHWTREQIADWVESIERAQEPVIATEDQPAMEPAVELGARAQK